MFFILRDRSYQPYRTNRSFAHPTYAINVRRYTLNKIKSFIGSQFLQKRHRCVLTN